MRCYWMWLVLAGLCWQTPAAERTFNFGEMPLDQPPPGFHSTVAGHGKPGNWKVILDEVPPLLAPFSDKAPVVTKRAVVAQLAQDMTDEHFPMLVFEEETYGDFTLTTRFKIVSGIAEQMAGIAFRVQDEKNFYVVRASALGNNVRFYKVVNGQRGNPIGPEIGIPTGVWHELTVDCRGNVIRCSLDGRELIPPLTDNSFPSGKIAFWTKSDSVSYFTDTKLTYTPREHLAAVLVRDALKQYPRLLGLRVYGMRSGSSQPQIVGSNKPEEIGQPGGPAEQDVLNRGEIYYAKGKESVSVTLPLRDRNGDPIAAVRVVMKTFPGQTEQNAIVRAMPIVKQMQARVQTVNDLTW